MLWPRRIWCYLRGSHRRLKVWYVPPWGDRPDEPPGTVYVTCHWCAWHGDAVLEQAAVAQLGIQLDKVANARRTTR